ncbi:MAG: type II toxin-antitoxin system HicA family toxin [Candidatus Rokubacteria bacterium]|nr:type II toxin-antitoxin system HicA family toxin [Candidatus Rokubacteria bacterium]
MLTRLRRFGIETRPGKGSHIILIRPHTPGGMRGLTYPVSCHRPGAEVSGPVIRAILRRFEISEDDFWAEG